MKKKEKSDEIVLNKNYLNGLIQYAELNHKMHDELDEQLQLDFQKWLESEKQLQDLSGEMPYCSFCDFCEKCKCKATQTQRFEERLCAKTFKKYTEEMLYEKYKDYKLPEIK